MISIKSKQIGEQLTQQGTKSKLHALPVGLFVSEHPALGFSQVGTIGFVGVIYWG
jgi:hypothetical protein